MTDKVVRILPSVELQTKKLNVCAYARVSSEKEQNTTSFESQIETYTDLINSNEDWNYCGIYADEGLSGTSMDNRTQFNLMLHRARSGLIDKIITKSISRFSRDTLDTIKTIREMTNIGVEIYFENEKLSTLDPKVETIITMLSGQAQEEASSVSKNCRWSLKKRYANGDCYFSTKKMLGLTRDENNEIIIVEDEAVAIRKMYEMYVNREPLENISNWLELNCIKTGTGLSTWSRSSVMAILRNEKYVGDSLTQKRVTRGVNGKITKNRGEEHQYLIQNNHPAIVDREIWNKAKEIRELRITKYNCSGDAKLVKKIESNKSIYAGLIQCSKCGKNYNYKINNSGRPTETKLFICSSNKEKRKCQNETLPTNVVDEMIVTMVNKILSNKPHFYELLKKGLETIYSEDPKTDELIELEDLILEHEKNLNEIKDKEDEFFTIIKSQLTSKITNLKSKKITLENKICTSFNIKMTLTNTKNLLRPYDKIKTIEEFPFKIFFNKIIIKSRNEIIFIVGNPRKVDMSDNVNKVFESEHLWYIRTSEIRTKFSVVIQ